MKTFDVISLILLAVFAVLGLAAPFALAAKARQPALIIATFILGTWTVVVLVSSAVLL